MIFSLISISSNILAADRMDTELKIGSEVTLLVSEKSYFTRRKGIDSLAGTIHTRDIAIHVDYGAYSPELTLPVEQQEYTKKQIFIDGLLATMLVYKTPKNQQHQNGPWYIGINFSNVRRSVIGSIRLTMYAWLQNEKQVDFVESVFKGIRFKH